jgi:hypothetical protein
VRVRMCARVRVMCFVVCELCCVVCWVWFLFSILCCVLRLIYYNVERVFVKHARRHAGTQARRHASHRVTRHVLASHRIARVTSPRGLNSPPSLSIAIITFSETLRLRAKCPSADEGGECARERARVRV